MCFFFAQEKIPCYSMIGINFIVYYLISKFSEVNDDEKMDQWVKYVEIKIVILIIIVAYIVYRRKYTHSFTFESSDASLVT